jgi:hypothetical protein
MIMRHDLFQSLRLPERAALRAKPEPLDNHLFTGTGHDLQCVRVIFALPARQICEGQPFKFHGCSRRTGERRQHGHQTSKHMANQEGWGMTGVPA